MYQVKSAGDDFVLDLISWALNLTSYHTMIMILKCPQLKSNLEMKIFVVIHCLLFQAWDEKTLSIPIYHVTTNVQPCQGSLCYRCLDTTFTIPSFRNEEMSPFS